MPARAGKKEETPDMPTATAKPKARAAKGAKRTTSRKTSTRASARSDATTTRARKTAGSKGKRAKAARTRAASQTRAAVRQARGATRLTASDRSTALGDYAERAVLIPVGAALTARDRVVSSVNGAFSVYSTPSKAQAQLRRFERRGATARNRLEREVRKARVRVERQLRQRRRVFERTFGELEDRRDTVAKNGSELAGELASRLQETVLSRV
jgi:hypothetical protein